MSSVRLLDLGVVGLASGLGFGKAGVCSTYYVTDCAQLKLVGQGGVGGACKLVVQCMVGQLPGGATDGELTHSLLGILTETWKSAFSGSRKKSLFGF